MQHSAARIIMQIKFIIGIWLMSKRYNTMLFIGVVCVYIWGTCASDNSIYILFYLALERKKTQYAGTITRSTALGRVSR